MQIFTRPHLLISIVFEYKTILKINRAAGATNLTVAVLYIMAQSLFLWQIFAMSSQRLCRESRFTVGMTLL